MKRLFAIFPALSLWATVNEPLRCEILTGYRNDRLHWHLQQPGEGGDLVYSEVNRDVQFWGNGLELKAIHRDLAFLLRGGYATFGKGKTLQRYANLSGSSEQPHFHARSIGWAADALGYFGYAVNLTADRTYKVILTPLIGFSSHFERLNRKKVSPDPFSSVSLTMQSALPRSLRTTWYGLFLGGEFSVEPGGRLSFRVGYTYHWLHLRFSSYFQSAFLPDGPILLSSIRVNDGGNLGHRGWIQADYLLSRLWRAGIRGELDYFCSRILDAKDRTTSFDWKYKLRATSLSGWLHVSREF